MADVYTWPAEWYRFTQTQFTLRTLSLGSRSSLSPRRTTRLMYQIWQVQMTYARERGPSSWAPKEAFFARLDGDVGLLRLADTLRCQPTYNRHNRPPGIPWDDLNPWSDGSLWLAEGLVPPTATLAAAATRGAKDIVIGGLPPEADAALVPGDLIEIRPDGIPTETSNLYEVVRGGATDEYGTIGIDIRPRLRQSVIGGDMAVMQLAQGVFQLADGDQGALSRDSNMGSFGFTAVEYTD